MGAYGYKYFQNVTKLVAKLISRGNFLRDLIPKIYRRSDSLSNLYRKTLQNMKKAKIQTGNRVEISNYELLFRNGYKPEFTKGVFEFFATAS